MQSTKIDAGRIIIKSLQTGAVSYLDGSPADPDPSEAASGYIEDCPISSKLAKALQIISGAPDSIDYGCGFCSAGEHPGPCDGEHCYGLIYNGANLKPHRACADRIALDILDAREDYYTETIEPGVRCGDLLYREGVGYHWAHDWMVAHRPTDVVIVPAGEWSDLLNLDVAALAAALDAIRDRQVK